MNASPSTTEKVASERVIDGIPKLIEILDTEWEHSVVDRGRGHLPIWFRGQADYSWFLQPTVHRPWFRERVMEPILTFDTFHQLLTTEQAIHSQFRTRGASLFTGKPTLVEYYVAWASITSACTMISTVWPENCECHGIYIRVAREPGLPVVADGKVLGPGPVNPVVTIQTRPPRIEADARRRRQKAKVLARGDERRRGSEAGGSRYERRSKWEGKTGTSVPGVDGSIRVANVNSDAKEKPERSFAPSTVARMEREDRSGRGAK